MPIKGGTEDEEKIIRGILSRYKQYEFYYYGSRVNGNYRPLSDLDILVESKNEINLSDIEDIKQEFDESRLPHIVNLSYNPDKKFYRLIAGSLVKCEA